MREAQVLSFTGRNEYGEPSTIPSSSRTIQATFDLYTHSPVEDPRYQEVQYVCLTKDKEIDDTNKLVINGKTYRVIFVNPFGRLAQVFIGN